MRMHCLGGQFKFYNCLFLGKGKKDVNPGTESAEASQANQEQGKFRFHGVLISRILCGALTSPQQCIGRTLHSLVTCNSVQSQQLPMIPFVVVQRTVVFTLW